MTDQTAADGTSPIRAQAEGRARIRGRQTAKPAGRGLIISQFDYTYRQDRSIATWKVDQGSGAKTWTFGYDASRQLTSAALHDATPTLLESNSYGYDKAGNRIQVGNGATAPKNYETNNQNQLLSERDHGRTTFAGFVDEPATVKVNGKSAKVTSTDGGAPFKFEGIVDLDAGANTVVVEAKDGQNNTTTKTYSVTTTGTSKTYEYDANGNLRYEKQPNGTVIREYRWDQQNRLVRMLAGTHESVYEYDGASRRVRIKELTSSVETKNETFVWCGSRICQKRASNGSTVVRSYFVNGFEESGTTDYFYTRDHLGSVREVMGSNGTTVASRLSYDLWGKVSESGSVLSDFGFTGHHYDRPTGLSLAHYRAYDPQLGRWLSKDPIGLRGGLNLYGYVNNDPAKFFDPTGRMPDDRYPGMPQDEIDATNEGSFWSAVIFALLRFPAVAFIVGGGASIEGDNDVWMALLGGSCAAERSGAEAAAPVVGRLPVPATPGGMPLREFGRVMNWGSGHAAARSQIPKLTRQGLQNAGVTAEIAQNWAQFYRNEALRNSANPSALGRAELMEAAVRLLQ